MTGSVLDSCSSSRLTPGWKSDISPTRTEPAPGDKIGSDLVNGGKGMSVILTSPRALNDVTGSRVIREWDASISGVSDGVEICPISSKFGAISAELCCISCSITRESVLFSFFRSRIASSSKFYAVTAVATTPDLRLYRSILLEVELQFKFMFLKNVQV